MKKQEHQVQEPVRITQRELRARRRRKAERAARAVVIGFVLLLLSGGALAYYYLGYRRASNEYETLTENYVTQRETATTSADGATTPTVSPSLVIDFSSLSEVNSDIAAWIEIPGCDISYPVVQGEDNDYYLNHTFEGNSSSNGAIFMDAADGADFTGFNTFVYGHNMRDGSMFGKLRHYQVNEGLITTQPYFYLYLPNGDIKKYLICSYYNDDGNSDAYLRPEDAQAQMAYIEEILQKSAFYEETTQQIALSVGERGAEGAYVTLSTCAGAAGSGQRFLVHGVLTETLSADLAQAPADEDESCADGSHSIRSLISQCRVLDSFRRVATDVLLISLLPCSKS